MKKSFLILFSALSLAVFAQDVKIALLQPLTAQGSAACNAMEISMVRGELRKAFGWQSKIQILTRLDVDAMLKEQGFQRSGMVDDAQRKKVGAMTGAQYICVSSITKYGTQLYIEAYLVDIETGQMTNPATQYVNVKNEDYSTLPASCNELAKEMLGEISSSSSIRHGTLGISSRPIERQNFDENSWDLNMKLIWVEGGDFMMGCTLEQEKNCGDDEKNVRHVTLDGFYIGMFEVTQLQWEKVMGTNIYSQMNKVNDADYLGIGPSYPMYYVSWEEAMAFCRLLSNKTGKTYTLPTEAQWEYAARGGARADGTKYSGSNIADDVAWYKMNSGNASHICGSKYANGLGIYDMSGNVWEWCKDLYGDNYIISDINNPSGVQNGEYRVIRGGGWNSNTPNLRVSYRDCARPERRMGSCGFRVVCIP